MVYAFFGLTQRYFNQVYANKNKGGAVTSWLVNSSLNSSPRQSSRCFPARVQETKALRRKKMYVSFQFLSEVFVDVGFVLRRASKFARSIALYTGSLLCFGFSIVV